jgi:drug/metabolite transporter (DMT)-like permease
VDLEKFMQKEQNEEEPRKRPEGLMWVFFACTATVCFALSAYILGIISVGGAAGKFLNSWGYLFVSSMILLFKNVKFMKDRMKLFRDEPEQSSQLSMYASLKDSCYFDQETKSYKWWGFFLSFICGLMNLGGEFGIIFSFQHALDSLMNQGILTSLFTLGAVIVLVGSVILLKEKVRFCEYAGVVLVILGTIFISFTKKGEEISEDPVGPSTVEITALVPKEGPGLALFFAIVATICFGVRGLILKYMGIKLGIDGISASSIFLMTDGLIGGIVGLLITLGGGGYASFPVSYIILGLVSGCLAGTGVLCLNISIMDGLAGPAVAMANLSAVIQALLDWGFLGQQPSLFETLGLIVAIIGAIVMAIGDDYIIKPIFYPDPTIETKIKSDPAEDLEESKSGEYQSPAVNNGSDHQRSSDNFKSKF